MRNVHHFRNMGTQQLRFCNTQQSYTKDKQTVHSTLFIPEIVEILRVLQLMVAILIFKCMYLGGGRRGLQLKGEGGEKNSFLQNCPLTSKQFCHSCKMTARNAQRSISGYMPLSSQNHYPIVIYSVAILQTPSQLLWEKSSFHHPTLTALSIYASTL